MTTRVDAQRFLNSSNVRRCVIDLIGIRLCINSKLFSLHRNVSVKKKKRLQKMEAQLPPAVVRNLLQLSLPPEMIGIENAPETVVTNESVRTEILTTEIAIGKESENGRGT